MAARSGSFNKPIAAMGRSNSCYNRLRTISSSGGPSICLNR